MAPLLVAWSVISSHGGVDALNDGGKGVALLWPLSQARLVAPWQPFPVAPFGIGFLSGRGLHGVAEEVLLFSPAPGGGGLAAPVSVTSTLPASRSRHVRGGRIPSRRSHGGE